MTWYHCLPPGPLRSPGASISPPFMESFFFWISFNITRVWDVRIHPDYIVDVLLESKIKINLFHNRMQKNQMMYYSIDTTCISILQCIDVPMSCKSGDSRVLNCFCIFIYFYRIFSRLKGFLVIICYNYINPGYGLSLVDTLWNASSHRQPLEQEGNPMT